MNSKNDAIFVQFLKIEFYEFYSYVSKIAGLDQYLKKIYLDYYFFLLILMNY